jgi:hypothetical protein
LTAAPDHRPSAHVTFACRCGVTLVLPPNAAEAAEGIWLSIHKGPGHSPTDAAGAARADGARYFEAFVGAGNRLR